ncbi:unnamed protein product [Menidia menidia]|uniref:(Atlantic silverside) hypothetical protein n=1 Tax=Menidia menidia TaxID=238744 RepID=A0A8S4B4I3_9TELE|nr:unnamed protein product [Menidia menidia]
MRISFPTLLSKVWEQIKEKLHFSPVILDPNTANGFLYLSDDLTSVRCGDTKQKLPENPERNTKYSDVFGSEGFSSGTHSWEVEVGDHPRWRVGLVKESVNRKGKRSASPEYGIWCLWHGDGKYTNSVGKTVTVKKSLQRIRVQLDYDMGEVSFYNSEDMTPIYTHRDTFTEKLFPFFGVDTNTASPGLYLSDDLTSVRCGDIEQKLPENPERNSTYPSVFGSEGFSSGRHSWEVEVGDHPRWNVGLVKESVNRKGKRSASPEDGVWCLLHRDGKYADGAGETVTVKKSLQRIRVQLDYDMGEVSFYNSEDMTHIYTHRDTFTEKLFPYFCVYPAGNAKTSNIKIYIEQKLPENPERNTKYSTVFGSEGFSSGTHSWEVEVGDHPCWGVGLVKESVNRKGKRSASPEYGIWSLWHRDGKYTDCAGETVTVKKSLQRIRVQLDYDMGEVSFHNSEDMTHICTHRDTFTEKLFPYFSVGPAKDAKTSDIKIC